MTAPYITPAELWRLARPGSCSPSEWEPGGVAQGVPTKTGSGALLMGGYPIDAWAGRVLVRMAGEPTGAPGGAAVQVSLDNGATYAGPLVLLGVPGVAVDVPYTGLTLTATAGAAPSFVVGDLWPFATAAGPEFLVASEAASRQIDEWLRDTYDLPLRAVDLALKRRVAVVARQLLMEGRGMTEALKQFRQSYDDVLTWLAQVGRGEIQLGVDEADGGTVFPSFCKPRPKYATDWRA